MDSAVLLFESITCRMFINGPVLLKGMSRNIANSVGAVIWKADTCLYHQELGSNKCFHWYISGKLVWEN